MKENLSAHITGKSMAWLTAPQDPGPQTVISEPSFFPAPVCTLLRGNFILSQVPTALLPTQSQLRDDILTVWQPFQKGHVPSKL